MFGFIFVPILISPVSELTCIIPPEEKFESVNVKVGTTAQQFNRLIVSNSY